MRDGPVTIERDAKEKAQGTNGLVEGAARDLALVDDTEVGSGESHQVQAVRETYRSSERT